MEASRDISDAIGSIAEHPLLSAELETTIYRLIQEALTNVVKHARASTVQVSLRLEAGEVVAEIHDAGVGFDPGARRRIRLGGNARAG